MSDDHIRELIEALQREADKAIVGEHERRLHDEIPPVPEGHVALFGFEGELDGTWQVPEPRPDVLRRPIPPPRRYLLAETDDEFTPHLRTASYRRIADATYLRFD